MSPTYSICKNHGYISGEQYTCPICGEETEVYSRITGYYRPVKNWNDGKLQEFKERKVYDVEHSHVKQENFRETEQEEEQRIFEEVNTEEGKVLLFTTKTCPNCKLAKESLEKANISYEVVDAGENEELVRKYGVMQAPTLIVIKEEGVQKLANASNIRAFAEKR